MFLYNDSVKVAKKSDMPLLNYNKSFSLKSHYVCK